MSKNKESIKVENNNSVEALSVLKKAYLVVSNEIPVICCTNEKEADSLSKNEGVYKMPIDLEIDKNVIRELAQNVLDDFEKMLEENDIFIPSEDREGNEEESCLFGDVYYSLEKQVIDTITNTLRRE